MNIQLHWRRIPKQSYVLFWSAIETSREDIISHWPLTDCISFNSEITFRLICYDFPALRQDAEEKQFGAAPPSAQRRKAVCVPALPVSNCSEG